MKRRLSCGPAESLVEGALVRVPVVPSFVIEHHGAPVRVTAALLARRRGAVVAYANLCRHVPLPLDLGDGVVTGDGRHFLCHHHGARFRVEDGRCVSGPCHGQDLVSIEAEVVSGEIVLWIDEAGHSSPRAALAVD